MVYRSYFNKTLRLINRAENSLLCKTQALMKQSSSPAWGKWENLQALGKSTKTHILFYLVNVIN